MMGMEVYKQIMIIVSFDNPQHQKARDGIKRKYRASFLKSCIPKETTKSYNLKLASAERKEKITVLAK